MFPLLGTQHSCKSWGKISSCTTLSTKKNILNAFFQTLSQALLLSQVNSHPWDGCSLRSGLGATEVPGRAGDPKVLMPKLRPGAALPAHFSICSRGAGMSAFPVAAELCQGQLQSCSSCVSPAGSWGCLIWKQPN